MAQRLSDSWDNERPAMFGRMRISTGRVELSSIGFRMICLICAGLVIGASFIPVDRNRKKTRALLALGAPGTATTSLALSPTGTSIATTDSSGRVTLWSRERAWNFERVLSSDFGSSVKFSPDGHFLAVGDKGASLSLWNLWHDPPVRTVRTVQTALPGPKFLAYSPDGRTLAEASKSSNEIVICDLTDSRAPGLLRGPANFASLAFSTNGQYLAAGELGDRAAVLIWKLDNPLRPRILEGQFGTVTSVAFSPDGCLLATCAAYERCVRLWDFKRGQLVRTTSGHAFGTTAVAFSPDRTTLASVGGDGKARLWSVDTGEELTVLDGDTAGLNALAFSADGRTLIASGPFDNDVRIWELARRDQSDRGHLADAARAARPHQSGGLLAIRNN